LNGGKRLAESPPSGKTSLFAHFPVGYLELRRIHV
jgi:hypothetical protein